jgi:hypothetical protein
MSRRSLRLPVTQLSLFDKVLCETTLNIPRIAESFERPLKRPRLAQGRNEWIPIHEVVFDCDLTASPDTSPSFPPQERTEFLNVGLEFDEFVITVLELQHHNPLVAYVVNENGTTLSRKLQWLQLLQDKNSHDLHSYATISFLKQAQIWVRAQVRLRIEIRFDSNLHRSRLLLQDRLAILEFLLDPPKSEANADLFYSSISGPLINATPDELSAVQHPSLCCKLFPFQARAIAWMLQREGVHFYDAGSTSSRDSQKSGLPPLWCSIKDLDKQLVYINRHQGYATRNRDWILKEFPSPDIKGGILAEVNRAHFGH